MLETVDDFRRAIRAKRGAGRSRELDAPSPVNPGLSHGLALDLLEKGIESLPASERLVDGTARRDLMARNIRRELGLC